MALLPSKLKLIRIKVEFTSIILQSIIVNIILFKNLFLISFFLYFQELLNNENVNASGNTTISFHQHGLLVYYLFQLVHNQGPFTIG